MKKIIQAILIFIITMNFAFAACTSPAGKRYVAAGGGQWVNTSGQTTNYFSAVFTVLFTYTGSATVVETGKSYSRGGVYSQSYTIPAIGTTGHTFNATTCQGQFTGSSGSRYNYVSSNSGNTLSGSYYGADNLILITNIIFNTP